MINWDMFLSGFVIQKTDLNNLGFNSYSHGIVQAVKKYKNTGV